METVIEINDWQRDIINECVAKKSGGLCLPMGGGKTIVSILSLLNLTDDPIIVIVSKTLIGNWVNEITKFFGEALKYEILHNDYLKKEINDWIIGEKTRLVLTTPEAITGPYKKYELQKKLIDKEFKGGAIVINHYKVPTRPLLKDTVGLAHIYEIRWGGLIIDEIAEHNNINTYKCEAMSSICAKYRWGLSGTMFPEPTKQRILGYYVMLDLDGPRTLPGMNEYIKTKSFPGLDVTMVKRTNNPEFKQPKVNQYIISHNLNYFEMRIYLSMKQTLKDIQAMIEKFKKVHDVNNTRKYISYCLSLIGYLRQVLICSMIPITSAKVDTLDNINQSELSTIIMKNISKLKVDDQLNNDETILSTRFKKVIEQINKYKNNRILLFSSYRNCLDVISQLYLREYNVMTIESSMSGKNRNETINNFNNSKNGILTLTYDIGANGLNLQAANVVILMDFYWNHDTETQAEARILRQGQMSSVVTLISFTSNTSLELSLLKKQQSKKILSNELATKSGDQKIVKMKLDDIIDIINSDDNEEIMKYMKSQELG